MDNDAERQSLLERIDTLWERGDLDAVLELSKAYCERWPEDVDGWHRVAVVHVSLARQGGGQDHLGDALSALDEAVARDLMARDARELRANLLLALAHHDSSPISRELGQIAVFQKAMGEFLRLEKDFPDCDRCDQWRLEAARAAFLVQKNQPLGVGDHRLSLELYNRTNSDLYDTGDWFFRGMATLENAREGEDPTQLRTAAACFLRALEEGGFSLEGRYFAADALLLLADPTDEEFNHAALLVQELTQAPERDFLIDVLKRRLDLRAKLTGRQTPEIDGPSDAPETP